MSEVIKKFKSAVSPRYNDATTPSVERGEGNEKSNSKQSLIEKSIKKITLNPTLANIPILGSDELEHIRSGKRFKPTLSEGDYDAKGLRLSLHGVVYQLKLLMLVLKRGLDNGYSFNLTTEMEDAEKFDDVVFEYIDGQGQRKHRFLQAKHKQESQKITINDLLTEREKGEFNLRKYFTSYRKIQQNTRFKGSLLENFVICTNIDFEFDECTPGKLKDTSKATLWDIRVEKITEEDNILKFKDQVAPRYRFALNKQGSTVQGPLVEALRDTSDSIRLAKALAHCVPIFDKKSRFISLRNNLFRLYHVALVKEKVIDTTRKTFHEEFIKNLALSKGAKAFRDAFLKAALRISKEKPDVDDFWQKMEQKKLNLSRTFGKVFELDNDPQLTDPKEFSEEIAKMIFESQQDKVVKIERSKKGIIKENIDKLAGHVLIIKDEVDSESKPRKDKKIKFRSGFLGRDKLLGNLENFRTHFEGALQSIGISFDELDQYQFKIKNFKTCEEEQLYAKPALPNDTVDDKDIEEFLNKLVFAVNQPNEMKLSELLKQETGEEFDQDSSRFIVDAFQVKMLDWMKEKEGRIFSHKEGKAFFDELKKIFTKQLPEQWQVPPRNQNFVDRKELEQIEKYFNTKENTFFILTSAPPTLTAHGMGGVGKTQLALEFVWRFYKKYEGVVWFHAENRNSLLVDYIRLGEELHIIHEDEKKIPIEERALRVKHWLEDPKRAGWLLIYDNAPKYGGLKNEGIDDLFPMKGGKILVTTRFAKGWPQESIEIKVFTPKESRAYIQKVLGDKALDFDQINQLAKTLGHLPLALAQACAYIKHTPISISGYLERYEAWKKEFLSDKILFDQTLPPDSHRAIVYITWDITMEAVRKESLLADKWLTTCAYLNSNDIPSFLLETFAGSSENNPNNEIFKVALGILGSYSMLAINEQNSSASVHNLVQEVIQLQSKEKGKVESNRTVVFLLLKECFPCGSEALTDYAKKRQLLPHLEAFLPQLNTSVEGVSTNEQLKQEREKVLTAFLELMVDGYESLGDAQKARQLLELVLPIHERHYGSEHPEVATALNNLGNAYWSLGDAEKARELLERALKINEHHYGPDHFKVAKIFVNLSNAYGSLGDTQKVCGLLKRALEIDERYYGFEHPEVAKTLINMGDVYIDLGDARQASEFLERALRINESHGHDHPLVAGTLTNLGNAYGDLGDSQKKCELLKRALKINESFYGPDHPNVAKTLTDLGAAYIALGDAKKARVLLEKALTIKECHYGPDHYMVASTLTGLSDVYGYLGDEPKQRELLERALEIRKHHYERDHVEVAKTLARLGNTYGNLRDTQKQCELLEQSLKILERHYGPDHVVVARALNHLGDTYIALGDTEKAREFLEKALPIFERYYKADHPDMANTLMYLGEVYRVLGDAEKGCKLQERALEIDEGFYGANHPSVAATLSNLGNTYGYLGNVTKKRELLERALSIFETYYKLDHPNVANLLTNLGDAYMVLGDAGKGCQFLERALAINEHHYGYDHIKVAETLTNLGAAYITLRNAEKARELLERSLKIGEHHYGSDHLPVATILMNLGIAYGDLGDVQKKCEFLERALSIQQHHGANHQEIVRTLTNLSAAYRNLGDAQKQCELLEQALSIQELHLALDHPDVASTLTHLGVANGNLGNAHKQCELLERALSIRERHFGPEHLTVACTLMCFGTAYENLGDTQKQCDILERALPILETHYGSNHSLVVNTLTTLGNTYGVLGDAQKACECYDRASRIMVKLAPLDLAASSGHIKVVQFLLEKGADLLARNHHDTILHQAVSGNNVEVIRLILDAIKEKCDNDPVRVGQAINARDNEGDTPLMWAAENGKVNEAQILLAYGADINAENNEGMTALNWAAKNDHLELAIVLLNHEDIHVAGLSEDQTNQLKNYIKEHHTNHAVRLIAKLK